MKRQRRTYRCPGCGWRVSSVVPSPWCHACKRHTEPVKPYRTLAAQPDREDRIVAHIARVEREMPREGTLDPLAPLNPPAL